MMWSFTDMYGMLEKLKIRLSINNLLFRFDKFNSLVNGAEYGSCQMLHCVTSQIHGVNYNDTANQMSQGSSPAKVPF